MLENVNANTPQVHIQSQQQQQSSISQISLDFDSILQELKSVSEAHQPIQQPTTMLVGNLTANMKEDRHTDGNPTGRRRMMIELGRKEVK